MTRWLAIMLLALGLGACTKSSDEEKESPAPEPKGPAIPPHEVERGKTACEAWAERACRCELDACDEAAKIPEALQMAVRAANGVEKDAEIRARLQLEARRIIARCIEEQAAIDPSSCPMKAPSTE